MARILIADDFVEIAQMLENIFLSEGHNVDVCANGNEAINKVSKNNYDLIVTDIVMPGNDGLEVTKYIREELPGEKKNVPIIAISGGGTSIPASIALSAVRRHADVILEKPFTLETFKHAMQKLLGE